MVVVSCLETRIIANHASDSNDEFPSISDKPPTRSFHRHA